MTTPRRRVILTSGAIILLAMLPLLGMLVALALAAMTGTSVSVNNPAPTPFSTAILLLLFGGMLSIYTIPLGALIMASYAIFLLVRRRRARSTNHDAHEE